MRPRANVIVLSIRPELRFVLRVECHVNVWPAETMPQFIKRALAAEPDQLVIIDRRDAPILAKRAANYLRRQQQRARTILLAEREKQRREPLCDTVVRDGPEFYFQLLNSVKIALARKRGPRKGIQLKVCPS